MGSESRSGICICNSHSQAVLTSARTIIEQIVDIAIPCESRTSTTGDKNATHSHRACKGAVLQASTVKKSPRNTKMQLDPATKSH